MIYITGDCHGDWRRFNKNNLPSNVDVKENDYIVVCGDFGIWHDTSDERNRLSQLKKKKYTILFVDGNHENFDRLNQYDEIDYCGGRAHKIANNIYHLMRGYVFTIENKRIFTFGGASSHDICDGILRREDYCSDEEFEKAIFVHRMSCKMFRIEHMSWWKEELPTTQEMNFGLDMLNKCGNSVDYVITHCAPTTIEREILDAMLITDCTSDYLNGYFEKIKNTIKFDRWYFGHYHCDYDLDSDDRFRVVYKCMFPIGE